MVYVHNSMNLFGHKVKWETVSLAALLGLIGIGFVAMLIAVFTANPPAEASAKIPTEEAVGPLRSKVKAYTSKQMTVHTFDKDDTPLAAFRGPDSTQSDLIPNVPDSLRGQDSSLNSMMDIRPNVPIRNKQEEDFFAEEEEDRDSTGWGWLADDIAKSKTTKEKGDKKADQKMKDEEEEEEEDDRLAAEKKKEESADKDKSKDYFFMNQSFGVNDADRDPLSRSALREDERDMYSDKNQQEDKKTNEEQRNETAAENRASEIWRASAEESRAADLGKRDPFNQREDGRPVFSDDTWGFSRDADISSRREENYQREDQSMRIIGDADNDARRMSVGWTGYSSDSMFNSGGGYTPRGVGSSGEDSLFSSAGVFENSAGIVTPIASSSDSKSLSPQSSFGTPSYSSPIGDNRSGTEIATPRALPW